MGNMRIINIMQGTNLGGMEQASLRLMLGLMNRGHACEVLSLNPIGSLGPLLEKQQIPAIGLPYLGKGGWRSFFRLWNALRNVRADALIMTGHSFLGMLALGGLCRGKRLLAIHFHHTGVKPVWQWRLIYRVACRCFQAITFPSDFIRAEAEELYPLVKNLAHTVRNPLVVPTLPTDEERSLARVALGIKADIPVIGNAGWLIPRKRFDVFLRVAHRVLQEEPTAIFLIAGDGEERTQLEAFARELDIFEKIVWLGWQQDLKLFYQSLDVMLFNSDFDAMGLSPLEAVSYGVPLVASVQQGGLKEIVDNDNGGFLLDSHDIAVLSEKTVYYVRNQDAARKAALECRDRIAQMSDTVRIAQEIESLLMEPAHV